MLWYDPQPSFSALTPRAVSPLGKVTKLSPKRSPGRHHPLIHWTCKPEPLSVPGRRKGPLPHHPGTGFGGDGPRADSHSKEVSCQMNDPILQVRDLCKVYGSSGNQVVALDHVSLTVNRGEFVSIVGPSGSGKSTLLHILGGVDKPTSGSVQVDGVELSTLDESRLAVFRRRQIGLVYQFYNLIPVLTVRENLTLPLLLDHRKPGKGQVKALAEELGIADRLNALPGQLSGGQQQRVSIGRALLTRPALVLADEPTGNLDTKNSAAIVELLKTFHKKYAQTLILITHDPDIALQAQRLIRIEDGRIVKDEVIRP